VLEILVISLVSVLALIGAMRAGLGVNERVIGMLSGALAGWRDDGWPRGIQEEDRDSPWNRGPRRSEQTREDEPPDLVPTLSRVKHSVRIR
jgi:hypothetical protein